MIVVLKVIHIYALMAGAAAGFGNAILMARLARHEGPPPALVAEFMATLGRMGRWAIVLLWLTGLGMAYLEFGTFNAGWVFYLKLVAASVVLLAVMYLGVLASRARAAGTPPDRDAMRRYSMIAAGGVFVAVVAAVVVFRT